MNDQELTAQHIAVVTRVEERLKSILESLLDKTYAEESLDFSFENLSGVTWKVLERESGMITDECALALAGFLRDKHTLKSLVINIVDRGPEMVSKEARKALAEAIRDNKGLERLDLTLTVRDAEDSEIFAQALEHNKNLQWLSVIADVRHDNGNDAILFLKRVIKNPNLFKVGFFGCSAIETLGLAIEARRINRFLFENLPEQSKISSITFDGNGMDNLEPCLENLRKLTSGHIKLDIEHLESAGLETLLPVISEIELAELTLRNCRLEPDEIGLILNSCSNIRKFELSLDYESPELIDRFNEKKPIYREVISNAILDHDNLRYLKARILNDEDENEKILMEHLEKNSQRLEFESKVAALTFMEPLWQKYEFDINLVPFILKPAGLTVTF